MLGHFGVPGARGGKFGPMKQKYQNRSKAGRERSMAQAGRTFRLCVSSTFSDLKAERNALQQEAFPNLRELCMQHGCRFQAIDELE